MSVIFKKSLLNEKEEKEYLLSLDKILLNDENILESYNSCINITKIEIGENVKSINAGIFSECHKLQEVLIHANNKSFVINNDCLINSDTGALVLGFGTPNIPDDIKIIDMSCFTNLQDVEDFYIGKSLENITTCSRNFNIKNITLSSENKNFVLEGNCLFSKDSNELVLGCENSIIPERTTSINVCAFTKCGMKKMVLPKNVRILKNCCFEGCDKLEEVVFNDGLNSLDYGVFYECTSLKEVNLPNSVSTIDENSFFGCKSLKRITSLGNIKEIPSKSFYDCGFEKLTISSTINNISEEAFASCKNLIEVTISDGVKKIGMGAFENCQKLRKVSMANSVTELSESVFKRCNLLEDVQLSSNIKEIPAECFRECKSLIEINLPVNLQYINSWAFNSCNKLEKINFEELKSIKKIKKDAFSGCKKLINNPTTAQKS